MKASEYIQTQLDKLKLFEQVTPPKDKLIESIIARILSKKFRKYSTDNVFKEHVMKVVSQAVRNNEPIVMVWVFGGYKLWRITTSPKVDWGELFSMIYFARYAKTVAEIYEPGVIFDFYSDDVIVSRMDNIPQSDLDAYQQTFRDLLKLVKAYLPKNVKLTYNRVAEQYRSSEFDKELEQNIIKLQKELPNGLPKVDEVRKALVELNVKLIPDQDKDPLWREKVLLVHDAYALSSKRRPYYRNERKLMVVNTPLSGALAIGTTKASVAKFWCGTGVLEKRGDEYIEKILSPKQIENTKINVKKIKIDGLSDKNFAEIGII